MPKKKKSKKIKKTKNLKKTKLSKIKTSAKAVEKKKQYSRK